MSVKIINLNDKKELRKEAAQWFSSKWDVPAQLYYESMMEVSEVDIVPQWYLALENNKIIGGIGIIENDFHQSKELQPNICALFVEEEYRMQGVADLLLKQCLLDLSKQYNKVYLLSDLIGFYEKKGWDYYGEVLNLEDGVERMYVKNI